MIKKILRNILSVSLVLLMFTVVTFSRLDRNGMDEAQTTPDKSKIWGWWPQVPWDKHPVTKSEFSSILNQPIDLTRKGKPGSQYRYKIKRINLSVDRQGKVLNRMVAEGELSRTLLREV